MCNAETLIVEIVKTEHAVSIYADGLISKEILNSCLSLVDKGIALDLFLEAKNELFLKGNPLLLNKCIQLINKGGSIFILKNYAILESWICMTDFKRLSYYSRIEQSTIHETDPDNSLFRQLFFDFENKKQQIQPFLQEHRDIQIKFEASEYFIIGGDSIELSWGVRGATKVIVQGIGEVDAFGKRKIVLTQNTILKIGAFNNQQSQIKAIHVRVSETVLPIQYDIGFISAGTKQYISLVNSDIHPHVYGISKGSVVKLTWKVPQAQSVSIIPFNLTEAMGEFHFTPSTSLNIEISAIIGKNILSRKIQIMLFPVPLFKEKLFSFDFNKKRRNALPTPFHLKEEIKKKHKEGTLQYKDLIKKIAKHQLAIRTKKFNLKTINTFLLDILKEKYFHRKEILNKINSIRSFYEQSSTRNGNGNQSL